MNTFHMSSSLLCPHHPLPPHTIYLSSPLSPPLSSVSSCCCFLFLFLFFLLICCCFYNCFPLLQVLLHNALGAGLFCSTCGLLPMFSQEMASPLLVKKNAWFYTSAHEQLVSITPSDPPPPLTS